MSMRVHTSVEAPDLLMTVFTTSETLVEVYGPNFSDVPVPCLAIEDAMNCEAWIVPGTLAELDHLVRDIRIKVELAAAGVTPGGLRHRPEVTS